MKKGWVQALLGLTLVAVLLQCALYLRGRAALTADTLHLPLPSSAGLALWQHPQGVNDTPPPSRPPSHHHHHPDHHHHPYSFVTNEPAACTPATELVIVVITAVHNFDDRRAVRDTWGSYVDDDRHNASLVFLLGLAPSPRLQSRLVNESRRFRDIVQEDFVDSYRNLSIKSVALLKWVTTYCNASAFVLKADDDMYVNVSNLVSALRAESAKSHSDFVLGHVFVGAKPLQDKDSKWYTPRETFSEKVYPRYTSGTCYAMTTSAARRLYEASAEVPLFWLEDIYITGLCSRQAGVAVVHHGGFSYQRRDIDGCHFRKAITGHKYTASEKRSIFRQVNDPNLKC